MKWINHQATAFCMTMVATGNPLMGIISSVASTLPDAIEMVGGGKKREIHRGMSHDVLLWGPVLTCLIAASHWPGLLDSLPICIEVPQMVATGTVLGVLMHLMTDGLSRGGIPVLVKYRFAAGWYKTFTWSEHKVSLLICLPCLAVAWLLGHLAFSLGNIKEYLC